MVLLARGKLRERLSLVITAITSLLLLMMPVYNGGRTLLEVNGPRMWGILSIPIVIAIAPLIYRRLKTSAAVAMLVFALVGGFSIGFFYLPAAILLAWPERR